MVDTLSIVPAFPFLCYRMFIMDKKLSDSLHGSLVITYMIVMPPKSESNRDNFKHVRLFTAWCTQASARAEFERFCEMNPALKPELLTAEFVHRGHVH
jgi:hypothetical protein